VSSVTAESVVDAYTKRFAVVGQPISHSRSPEIFAALSRVSGVPLSYERLELTPEAFDARLPMRGRLRRLERDRAA